jgi:rifampin ADP-ribosylating transferase
VRASLSWFPLFASVPEWYVEARVHDALDTPAVVWRETLKGLMTARPPSVDAHLRGPGLVIWGERDDLLRREDEEALTAAIDGAELLVYPRTGHLVLWEQPEQVAGDAVRFLEAVRAQRTR